MSTVPERFRFVTITTSVVLSLLSGFIMCSLSGKLLGPSSLMTILTWFFVLPTDEHETINLCSFER